MITKPITEPGFYDDIPETVYHADCAPEPSLSNSIAVEIIQKSPMHGAHAHPRLNPKWEPTVATADMDFGAVFHALLLQGSAARITVIDAKNYQKKDAQEERDAARAANSVPILAGRYDEAQEMVEAVRRQLAGHAQAPDAFSNGRPEVTGVWRERDLWFRMRVDWLPNEDGRPIWDLKTTGGSARPDDWIRRHLFEGGYDVQASLYTRGLRALGRKPGGFGFVVVENKPPYALSVVALEPAAMALADRKAERAIALWGQGIRAGKWPGYVDKIAVAELPPWEEARWMEREFREGMAA